MSTLLFTRQILPGCGFVNGRNSATPEGSAYPGSPGDIIFVASSNATIVDVQLNAFVSSAQMPFLMRIALWVGVATLQPIANPFMVWDNTTAGAWSAGTVLDLSGTISQPISAGQCVYLYTDTSSAWPSQSASSIGIGNLLVYSS